MPRSSTYSSNAPWPRSEESFRGGFHPDVRDHRIPAVQERASKRRDAQREHNRHFVGGFAARSTNSTHSEERSASSSQRRATAKSRSIIPIELWRDLCSNRHDIHNFLQYVPEIYDDFFMKEKAHRKKRRPHLHEVPKESSVYKTVKKEFKKGWEPSLKKGPKIKHVYEIHCAPNRVAQYESYKAQVEAHHNFRAQNLRTGNEQYTWDGLTALNTCGLGEKPDRLKPCSQRHCAMCQIINDGHKPTDISGYPYWSAGLEGPLQFGRGIFSAKYCSYAHNTHPWRDPEPRYSSVVLNTVVVGKVLEVATTEDMIMTRPPYGYDSTFSEQTDNGPEYMVYNGAAILPAYLVIYKRPRGNWRPEGRH